MRPTGSPPFTQTAWRTLTCKVCGMTFQCSRIDREYCGATCRQRHKRGTKYVPLVPDVKPVINSMEVPSRATVDKNRDGLDHVTPLAIARKKAKSKPAKRPARSKARSKPAKKGGKKK